MKQRQHVNLPSSSLVQQPDAGLACLQRLLSVSSMQLTQLKPFQSDFLQNHNVDGMISTTPQQTRVLFFDTSLKSHPAWIATLAVCLLLVELCSSQTHASFLTWQNIPSASSAYPRK